MRALWYPSSRILGRTFRPQSYRCFSDWQSRFQRLREESKLLGASSTKNIPALLAQWKATILVLQQEQSSSSSSSQSAVDDMYAVYKIWKETKGSDPKTIETAEPFQHMLDAFRQTGQSAHCMKVLQDWHAVSGNVAVNPPPVAYDTMIAALAEDPAPPDDALPMTMEVIAVLERQHWQSSLPNLQTYANVVRVIANSRTKESHQAGDTTIPDNPSKTANLLQRFTDKFFQKLDPKWKDAKSFEALVHVLHDAMLFLEEVDEVHVAEYHHHFLSLLDKDCRSMWLSLDESLYPIIEPSALLLLKRLTAPAASALVLRLADMDLHSGLPSGRHFLTAIRAWRNEPESIAEQTLLLEKMSELHTSTHLLNPSSDDAAATLSFNNLLQAHLDVGLPNRTKELWDENQDRRLKQRRIRRNTQSFTILLEALAAPREDDTPMAKKERAQQANSLLQKTLVAECPIFDLSAQHFASVMTAWTRSHDPHAAEYCQQVFEEMLAKQMVPDAQHYHALIVAWGYSRLPDASQRVTEAFDAMQHDEFYEPKPQILAPVFFAYSRTDPQFAKDLLERFGDVSLNTECFNAVAISNTDIAESVFRRHWQAFEASDFSDQYRPNAVSYMARAKVSPTPEFVLNECEAQAALGYVEYPTAALYTEVMRFYGERGDIETVDRIFERMKASFRSGNLAAKPDAHAVTTLLRAVAWSSLPDKVQRCQSVLDQMVTDYEAGDITMKPTNYTYGSILSACTTTDEPYASDVAFEIFEKVVSIDNYTPACADFSRAGPLLGESR
jgi:pentatricopeptide repeat protein